jgi:uncharacterized protein YcbK (DUF882 family)
MSEFDCPCDFPDCHKNGMSLEFISMLDKARGIAGVPFIITSGYRCKKYNDMLQFSEPDSAHIRGLAADIAINSPAERYNIIKALHEVRFRRFGIYPTHIHVDNDPTKISHVIWYK